MIVGTNIGAGVLSIAYASSKAGFLPLLFWLVLVGSLTTVTMLYGRGNPRSAPVNICSSAVYRSATSAALAR
ncbi:tyrosine-specific transporter [Klebsiella variicola]|nr:tyrosine-specific transporter [Klebsiella variicola]